MSCRLFRRIRCRLMDEENVIPLVLSGQQRIDQQTSSRVEPAALPTANEEPHAMNAPVSTGERVPPSPRKLRLRDSSERMAPERHRWIERNAYFYEDDYRYMRFLIPEGSRVLDLGCGIGDLLAALKPSIGVGVDFSAAMLEQARARHPHLRFVLDPSVIRELTGPFDYIVLSDTIGALDDCEATLAALHPLCHRETRLIVSYYSHLWEPIMTFGSWIGMRMPQVEQNFLPPIDIQNLLALADFEVVKREWRQLLPRRLLGLGPIINRYFGSLPLIRSLCLRHYLVARSVPKSVPAAVSATIVVPCRNERGNIEAVVRRIPRFCEDQEIIFVEGHSKDGTREEIERVIAAHRDRDLKLIVQDGVGKADAVFNGFAQARADVLMILDADLTMPPEQLPKFWNALASGKGEFINGSRLVYPMEKQAMRLLNLIANRVFSILFTWLLNQRFTDTLCGTKVLMRKDYERIRRDHGYFGDFDPFGDFELIFGASKLGLKVVEVPVRYANRTYGETQISRFQHGLLLIRMVAFAYRKLKAL
jgi:SAM-dependent methyltransferase